MNPATKQKIRCGLGAWFDRERRDLPWRGTSDAYRIWVSEVMLQQTQVQTVVPYYQRFVTKYPDIVTLADADLQELLKTWEGMGYYARIRNLHRAARLVLSDYDGHIPLDYRSFRSLPGVGDYIAAAVLSIATGQALAAVDGNVKRVLARLFGEETPINTPAGTRAIQVLADELLTTDRPGDFNQALMELGATICRPRNPLCDRCPVAQACLSLAENRTVALPVKKPRKPVPRYHIAIGVVRRGEQILITRRPEEGLLGGLWEFPGGKVQEGEAGADACRREIREETGLDVTIEDHLTRIGHAYTHFHIEADVYTCRYNGGDVVLDGPTDHRWILVDELDDYPLPVANHKFLPILRQRLTDN